MILPEYEANKMLALAGIPMIPVEEAASSKELQRQAERLGFPVALKLSSAKHTHKTEIGGVLVNIATGIELQEAFSKLTALRERLDPEAKIIIEPMASSGAEFFIGYQDHPLFGPIISLGLGGVSLELFKDVAFRLLPARTADFKEMLKEIESWPAIRKGFRNLPPIEEERVIELLGQVAELTGSCKGLKELDLNPVIFLKERIVIADATVILQ